MTDIVERLRNRAFAATIIKDKADLYNDAADAIIRLCEENERLQKEALSDYHEGWEEGYAALKAENERLREAIGRLKGAFRVNMLYALPDTPHDVIDAEIAKALGKTE